ncbi:MAG: hypothetical protein IJ111_03800 [Eggerthellaceae bacterium]|nr:hypothetical protein [Eggerthellaceae bacterium]
MPKKKSRVPKSGPVWHRTPEQATLDQMPKYNAHACGTGAHGDTKYNRAKQKRNWQRDLNREDARTRGRLPFGSPVAGSHSEWHTLTRLRGCRQ